LKDHNDRLQELVRDHATDDIKVALKVSVGDSHSVIFNTAILFIISSLATVRFFLGIHELFVAVHTSQIPIDRSFV